ncbi:hypothetical protein ZTR_10384 [Talaromyces verruculosus]|nr:hypothetical protein ZTR_10384 [Talaromyces verruculosus]
MFRSAIVRSLRASVPRTVRAAPRIQIIPAVRPSQFVPVFNTQTPRFYSAPASLSKEEVEGRIVNLLKNFDKEFSIEIPDKDADAIHSVEQAVSYILSQPDAH